MSAWTGTPASVVGVTLDQVRTWLIGRGLADWEADHFEEMYGMFKAGDSEFVTDTVREVTGAEPPMIEAFLDEILVPDEIPA